MHFVRVIDELGRVCVPPDIRKQLDLIAGDSLSIRVEGDKIVILKSAENCKICDNTEDLELYDGVGYICGNCAEIISRKHG